MIPSSSLKVCPTHKKAPKQSYKPISDIFTADELISQVNNQIAIKWQNSDISNHNQTLLTEIALHYSMCDECRNSFDDMEYLFTSLKEFECMLDSHPNISDWICD